MLTLGEALEVLACLEGRTPVQNPRLPSSAPVDALPGTQVPVVTSQDGNGMRAQQLSWGFDLPGSNKLVFNTRLERAATSTFWRDSFTRRRCAVPTFSFCETHRDDFGVNESGKRVRQVYRFSPSDGALLLMGGIWQDGRFSVLTTAPSQTVAAVHDRMPLLLDIAQARSWLAGGAPKAGDIGLAAAPLYSAAPAPDVGNQLGLF